MFQSKRELIDITGGKMKRKNKFVNAIKPTLDKVRLSGMRAGATGILGTVLDLNKRKKRCCFNCAKCYPAPDNEFECRSREGKILKGMTLDMALSQTCDKINLEK